MANSAANVRVGITGALSVDLTGSATAPTSVSSALTGGWTDAGYVSDDGVTVTLPGAPDKTTIKAWQNGAVVRVIRTPSDDNPQIQLTLIETKLETIEFAFGVTVTQTATDGSFVFNSNTLRDVVPVVLDVIDGAELIRYYAPLSTVTELAEIKYANSEAVGYQVTLDLDFDETLGTDGGQFQKWISALKTEA